MNFTRGTSKNSIKSASSFGRGRTDSDEKSELHGEIESLKKTIESLKSSIENRDAAIGKLAREKEKVFVELKGAQRTIRNLQQQLCDERTIHTKEKEYLVEEIRRLSRKEEFEGVTKKVYLNQTNIVQEEEIKSFQDQLLKKDEVICKLCEKYLKLKESKSSLQRTLKRVKSEVQQTHEKTICLLEENKHVMNKLFKKMCRSSSISLNRKQYLKLLKDNIKLQNENAQLKLSLSTKKHIGEDGQQMGQENEYDPIVTPLQRSDKSQQTNISSEEIPEGSLKQQIRRHNKRRPHKLKKLNIGSSLALLGSLYRNHLSHSDQLHTFLKKSSSMPCLRCRL